LFFIQYQALIRVQTFKFGYKRLKTFISANIRELRKAVAFATESNLSSAQPGFSIRRFICLFASLVPDAETTPSEQELQNFGRL
jgi:hypothetical protein